MMMASLREWLPGIALSVLLLGLAAPALAGETLDRVLSRGVMVMSTDPDYPPQSFRDSAGEFRGFDVDVGREIAERLGVDVEFVTPSWEAITAGSWNGRWDVSIGSMVPTPARAKVLDFPAVYYYMPARSPSTGTMPRSPRRPPSAAGGSGSARAPSTRAI
jgi:polar amino acid transport system substrate-binding protein